MITPMFGTVSVEIGLEARGVPRAEREARAEAAIEVIGLGGFEKKIFGC